MGNYAWNTPYAADWPPRARPVRPYTGIWLRIHIDKCLGHLNVVIPTSLKMNRCMDSIPTVSILVIFGPDPFYDVLSIYIDIVSLGWSWNRMFLNNAEVYIDFSCFSHWQILVFVPGISLSSLPLL